MIKVNKGLQLPITGDPENRIDEAPTISTVAILGSDYIGMKPTMLVREGHRVKLGQPLFTDKKNEGVIYTSPASGVVEHIHRGAKRVLQSVVIRIEGDDAETFQSVSPDQLSTLEKDIVKDNLVKSGLWTAFRTRPYSKVPSIDSVPNSIFVSAMDTNPLAADPALIINENSESFSQGLIVLTRLIDGNIFVCKEANTELSVNKSALNSQSTIQVEEFSGVHPAGLAGTHIHFLDPVGVEKTVWTIGYQDVIAIGKLFTEGKLYVDRIVSLAGPQVNSPRLLRSRVGASLDELTSGQLLDGESRIISGSIFGGRTAQGPVAYLGRYHNQVSVLKEGREREFMGWLSPGRDRHSVMGIYLSHWLGLKTARFTTSTNGSERAMVPVGNYERVMPLDILPTQLLRALIVGDTETAQKLGCLELDEEDVALCTYVCPGKYEYGPILRRNLTQIDQEG